MDHQPTLAELAEQGNLLELQRRLDCGEDVNSPDVDGRVALHAAFAEGDLRIGLLLLGRNADPHIADATGHSIVHWAARANNRAMLELACDASGFRVDVVDADGRTPASWMAQGNNLDSLEWLLQNGADPNRVDRDGWGPLHHAAAEGNSSALRLLLRAGARPLLRLPPADGEDFGHAASDLARHFASQQPEALLILTAAEEGNEIG